MINGDLLRMPTKVHDLHFDIHIETRPYCCFPNLIINLYDCPRENVGTLLIINELVISQARPRLRVHANAWQIPNVRSVALYMFVTEQRWRDDC